MPKIYLTEQTAAALTGLTEPHDLRGPDGRLLGQFLPAPPTKMSIPECGLTDEELDRRMHDPNAKWYTSEQVMARLREIDAGPGDEPEIRGLDPNAG